MLSVSPTYLAYLHIQYLVSGFRAYLGIQKKKIGRKPLRLFRKLNFLSITPQSEYLSRTNKRHYGLVKLQLVAMSSDSRPTLSLLGWAGFSFPGLMCKAFGEIGS